MRIDGDQPGDRNRGDRYDDRNDGFTGSTPLRREDGPEPENHRDCGRNDQEERREQDDLELRTSTPALGRSKQEQPVATHQHGDSGKQVDRVAPDAVSYTHLTLPTSDLV